MSWNEPRTSGMRREARPDAGGTVPRSFPVFGIVKDNIDPLRLGRLQVYIVDNSANNSDDANSWITVSYMSPFYGMTPNTAPNTGYGTYETNSNSYGMWTSPPDIGTTVICIFVNGDPNFGFWIGAIPEPEALHMLPAIGASENVIMNETEASSYGGATRLPVVNINSNNSAITDTSKFLFEAKPVHSYQAGILNNQGLLRDPIRGTIGSNAQRESPSRVTGISTPGRPVYEGGFTDQTIGSVVGSTENGAPTKVIARRGGHSLVMDDGDLIGRDQLIRLRTAMGHQILMSDDGQCLFIIHSNGLSWIELGKEGTVDIFATNSFNVRTQGDLNLHADRDININAKRYLNIKSEDQTKINSEAEMEIRSTSTISMYSKGNYTVKSDASMSYLSNGDAGFKSDNIVYVEGSRINLNSGSASLIPQEPKLIAMIAHTDTLWDNSKGFIAAPAKLTSIVNRAPAHTPWSSAGSGVDIKVNLTASSALPAAPTPAVVATASEAPSTPAVPVSAAVVATVPTLSPVSSAIDSNTTGALLGTMATAASTGATADAVRAGAGIVTGGDGIKTAAIGVFAATPDMLQNASVLKPGSAPLVNSLIQQGKNVTQAMPSAMFTGAGGATSLRAFTNSVPIQSTAMVGVLQQSQTGLTNAGIITGREAPNAITGIVLSGATAGVRATIGYTQAAINSSISKSLSRSVAGINNPIASTIARSVTGAVAGSVSQVVNATAGAVTTSVIGSIKNSLGLAPQAISSGNFAGTLAATKTGAMGSVSDSLKGMVPNLASGGAPPTPYDDDGNLNPGWKINGETGQPYVDVLNNIAVKGLSQGVPAAAFSSIAQSLPTMTAGVPQNIRQITTQATATAQGLSGIGSTIANAAAGAALGAVNAAVRGAAYGVGSAVTGAATGAVNRALSNAVRGTSGIGGAVARSVAGAAAGSINASISAGVGSVVNASIGAVLSPINSAAGINLIPGAQSSVAAVVNRGLPTQGLPGTDFLTGAITNVARSVVSAAANSTTNVIAGEMNKAVGKITTSINKSVGGGIIGKAIGAGISGALRGATGATINELKRGTNSIVGSVLSGLPLAAQSQVNATLSAMNSGGGAKITLPPVATNTSDINSINSKFKSLAGAKVPPPLYGGNPATVGGGGESDEYTKLVDWSQQVAIARDDYARAQLVALEAEGAYNEAKVGKPPGDLSIDTLRQDYYQAKLKESDAQSKLTEIEQNRP